MTRNKHLPVYDEATLADSYPLDSKLETSIESTVFWSGRRAQAGQAKRRGCDRKLAVFGSAIKYLFRAKICAARTSDFSAERIVGRDVRRYFGLETIQVAPTL